MDDALASLLGAPFHLNIDRLLDADLDELTWLLGLIAVRHDLEKSHG